MAKRIAVIDFETDPFNGCEVKPFLAGFHDGTRTVTWWNKDPAKSLADFISALTGDWIIYAHNGGRFDFFFLLPWVERRDIVIVDSRILRCHIGRQQLRDSYAILPFGLHDFSKDEIDYTKMHRDRREKHKSEILQYHSRDLTSLYELVSRFRAEFGDSMTLGSAAMKELVKIHPFARGTAYYDRPFRQNFFIGGRNEQYCNGVIDADIQVTDVNSMYPSVMSSMDHPTGTKITRGSRICRGTFFVVAQGENYGAFPIRNQDTHELDFQREYGTFSVTIHEWNAALETGMFRPDKILDTYSWDRYAKFDGFVSYFHVKRVKCQKANDKAGDLIYKSILNGSYGKFAQNPDRYTDYYLSEYGEWPSYGDGWTPQYVNYAEKTYMIWGRPAIHPVRYNIATAASITGGARAQLLRGLNDTARPLYCDTDSIISRDDTRPSKNSRELGVWRLECRARKLAMVRRKVYALFDARGTCVKKANAGCVLSEQEILRAAGGEKIVKLDLAPTFNLGTGKQQFRKNEINRRMV